MLPSLVTHWTYGFSISTLETMNLKARELAPIRVVRELFEAARDDLHELRQARAAEASLQRELASYTSPSEIADLLGVLRDQEGPEVQHVRDLLVDNVRPSSLLHHAA